MKAIILKEYGGPEKLELIDTEKPTIKDNQLLIEIEMTNIASGDYNINTLNMSSFLKPIFKLIFGFEGPRKQIRGISASGTVKEVGSKVTKYKAGDKVYFINSMGAGALAEYIVLNENSKIAPIPKNINFEEAAPIAFGALSAYHFINEKNINKGDKVLIYGASGSVGTYAVQLAKYYGADVTAVCSKKNHELVQSIGADHVIDYKTTDFTKQKKQYDVILDAVTKLKKGDAKKVLKPKGKYLSLKSPTSENVLRLHAINKIIEEGKLKTVLEKIYPLNEYREAHEHAYSGHKVGNVIVNIKK